MSAPAADACEPFFVPTQQLPGRPVLKARWSDAARGSACRLNRSHAIGPICHSSFDRIALRASLRRMSMV